MTPLIISYVIKFIYLFVIYSERSSICREQSGTAGAVPKRTANFKLLSSWQHTATVWVQCGGCWALSCVPVHAQWLFRGSSVMSGNYFRQYYISEVERFWAVLDSISNQILDVRLIIIMERHIPVEFMLSMYALWAFADIIGHMVHLLHIDILLQSLKQWKMHWKIIFHCI